MALDFNSAGGARRVDHGSAAVLDDLAGSANGFTVWAWVRRAANGANQFIVAKENLTGWGLLVDVIAGEGQLRLAVFRATTNTDYQSAPGAVPLDQWAFVSATFQDSRAPEVDLFVGSLATPATEVSYSGTTDGSGAPSADAASSLAIGNSPRTLANPFLGMVARAGIVNRVLELDELRRLQFAPMPRVAAARGTVLAAEYLGTGLQLDWSGQGNHGTVTSAVATSDRPRWGRRRAWAVNTVAAPPATGSPFYYAWRRRAA